MSYRRDQKVNQHSEKNNFQYSDRFKGEPLNLSGEPVHTSGKCSEGQSR